MSSIVKKKFSSYIQSIEKSLEGQNWVSALSIAFMLPDMCSKLEYEDVERVGDRYRKWFDEYLSVSINNFQPMITAHDFYALRCSYIHSGESDISDNTQRKIVDEFKFRAPIVKNNKFYGSHMIKINQYLILRVDLFCLEISEAVKRWVNENEDNKQIQEKAERIIEISADSISYEGVYVE